jgi:RHS repeat-associated protein
LGADLTVLRERDTTSDGIPHERLYVQQDAQGNVTALVNTSGVVVERSVEDPYGVRTVLTPSFSPRSATLYDWKYYHQGLRLDASGTLYDNRARMYSPTLMRFLQNDPLGFGAGDPNTYRYEGNGPTGGLDPGGMEDNVVVRNGTIIDMSRNRCTGGYGIGPIGSMSLGLGNWNADVTRLKEFFEDAPTIGTYLRWRQRQWDSAPAWMADPRFGNPACLPPPEAPWWGWLLHGVSAGAQLPGAGGGIGMVRGPVAKLPAGARALTAGEGASIVNRAGITYPSIIDPRTGEAVSFPTTLVRTPLASRLGTLTKHEKKAFIQEWQARGFAEPAGGWDAYQIHHIQPREWGGTHAFENLVPVERRFHEQVVTPWWNNFAGR